MMILLCFTALVKLDKTSLKLYQNFRPTSIKPLLTSSLSLLCGTSFRKIYLQIGFWLMVKYPGSSALLLYISCVFQVTALNLRYKFFAVHDEVVDNCHERSIEVYAKGNV